MVLLIAANVPGLAEGVDLALCPPGPEVEFII